MVNSPKQKESRSSFEIRETLFGDLELDAWIKSGYEAEPWASFGSARDALREGNRPACIQTLQELVNRRGLESRHCAEGWHVLKQLGVLPPPEIAKDLLGVIIEVGMENGLDLLAAYSDLRARYYNFSGAAVVWERPDTSLDPSIQQLLSSARPILDKIGPWNALRPAPPQMGYVRINMLTPSGLHFGQGLMPTLISDVLAGPVVRTATALMQIMIKKV